MVGGDVARSGSPASAAAMLRMSLDTDIRNVLGSIHVPTLVSHEVGDIPAPIEGGRYVAEHIPGTVVELPGDSHLFFFVDRNELIDEVQQFFTGMHWRPKRNRVLATVVFTDVVRSTEHAVELGDEGWADLLEQHHATVLAAGAVRRTGDRHGGRRTLRQLRRPRTRRPLRLCDRERGARPRDRDPGRVDTVNARDRREARWAGRPRRRTGRPCGRSGRGAHVEPRSRIWWPVLACPSSTGAANGSRACPTSGNCLRRLNRGLPRFSALRPRAGGRALGGLDELLDHVEHDLAGRLPSVHRADDLADEVVVELLGARARVGAAERWMRAWASATRSAAAASAAARACRAGPTRRSTRSAACRAGLPVSERDRTVSADVAARNFSFTTGWVSASSVVSHTEPHHTPSAPRARAAAIWRPRAMPPAASTGIGRDGVDDLGHEHHRADLAGVPARLGSPGRR